MKPSRVRTTGQLVPAAWWDAGIVGVLALIVVGTTAVVVIGPQMTEDVPEVSGVVALAHAAVSLAMVIALWWRRAHPVRVLVVVLALALVVRLLTGAGDGGAGDIATLVALYTATAARGGRLGFTAAGADVLITAVAVVLTPSPVSNLIAGVIVDTMIVLVGMVVHARRAYVVSLRDRAERLERERVLETIAAVAEERRRIARELHDVVAHHVSVMTLQAGGLEQRLRADGSELEPVAASIRSTGREAMTELRRLLGVLRSDDASEREPQPDLARIPELVDRMRDAGLPVTFARRGVDRPVGASVSVAAFRIVQEALTNTLRHAGRTPTTVTVTVGHAGVDLEVCDDGPRDGSPPPHPDPVPAHPEGRSGGHGIGGMRERAALFGGFVEAGPRPDGGWRVAARLPEPSAAPAPVSS